MTDQTIRLSDAEREAAAADLGEHFAQGRLTADEHAERLEQVWAAKTRGEVAPIFRDLPSPYAAVASTPTVARDDDRYWNAGLRPFRRGVPAPLLLVLAVLIVLSAIAHFPLFLLGFAVFWFVVLRHRGPRRAYAAAAVRPPPPLALTRGQRVSGRSSSSHAKQRSESSSRVAEDAPGTSSSIWSATSGGRSSRR